MRALRYVLPVLIACTVVAQEPGEQLTSRNTGLHERVWQSVKPGQDGAGRSAPVTNSWIELATGLNYLDPQTGQLEPTVEEFEITPKGYAVALRGPHRVIIAPNINEAGSIDLQLPDGQRLTSNPMGLSYFDSSTGKNVLLAEVKDCVGEWVTPNTIIFYDAFDTLKASLRYTYTRAGFEQDVVIQEDPGTPEAWGLNADTATLEIYTEFHTAPTPRVTSAISETGESENVDFGSMGISRGRAFFLKQDFDEVEVLPTWTEIEGRQFLIESIRYREAEALFEKLQARTGKPSDQELAARTFPSRQSVVASLPARSGSKEFAAITPSRRLLEEGLVLDYALYGSQTNFVLKGDLTYHVTAPVYLEGLTVVEGGAVVKFARYASTNYTQLQFKGGVDWRATRFRQAIFTGVDDNSVGSTISGSTGTPSGYYAYTALDLYTPPQSYQIAHVQIRNAYAGMVVRGSYPQELRHATVQGSTYAVYSFGPSVRVQNVLIRDCALRVFHLRGSATALGEHLTLDGLHMVGYPADQVTLTNSILSSVTNWTYAFSGAHNATSSPSVFQSAWAGNYYLADNTLRNVGSTNISAGLAADLKSLTTYPPQTLAGPITTPTTLYPVVQRDTDLPDLGFHYPPLDYVASNVVVQAALTLTNGVAIGSLGSYGFSLQTSSPFTSEGSPVQLNRLVHIQNVQEGLLGCGYGPTLQHANSSYSPSVDLRFTEVCGLPGYQMVILDVTGKPLTRVGLSHCVFRGGLLSFNPSTASAVTVGITNSLFEDTYLGIWKYTYTNTPIAANVYNNLLRRGGLQLAYYWGSAMPGWNVRDNLFDGASQSLLVDYYGDGTISRSHNGFTAGTSVTLGGSNNKTNLTADFVSGPLGPFYYPATGGSTSLTNLVNTGSRLASAAGLYHFTTTTNQVKEASGQVDIGLHYVAVDASTGLPVDYDGDGLPDYWEDRDGDGAVDTGETSWQDPADLGLRVRITEPKPNSNLP